MTTVKDGVFLCAEAHAKGIPSDSVLQQVYGAYAVQPDAHIFHKGIHHVHTIALYHIFVPTHHLHGMVIMLHVLHEFGHKLMIVHNVIHKFTS